MREVDGPPGAPTVLLLHGLIASAGLNWFQAFDPLGEHFRVLAPDLRGHGRGIRTWSRFRLADCADDVAALLDQLDVGPVIVVGYSMGGPVAQLLWHRHPDKVAGLVFCATSNHFVPGVRERLAFVTAVSVFAGSTRVGQLATQLPLRPWQSNVPPAVRARPHSFTRWAAAEMQRHDPRMVAEALAAIGTYDSRKWLRGVDVPTTLLVTAHDRAVPPHEQLRLLLSVPDARVVQVEEGHTWCAKPSFGSGIRDACLEMAGR